jgi:hypothetical protein
MSSVLGVVVLARNGDRKAFHQDPKTYAPGHTDSTPLGVVRLLTVLFYFRRLDLLRP